MNGLRQAQRAYDRMEPQSRKAIELSSSDVERHIKGFADGVSEYAIGDCADLLRELAVQYVRGNGANSYFWKLMVAHATTIATESEEVSALDQFFAGMPSFPSIGADEHEYAGV